MHLNLNKANRYLTKLKPSLDLFKQQCNYRRYATKENLTVPILEVELRLTGLTPQFLPQLSHSIESIQTRFQDMLVIIQDYCLLKEELFTANQISGISRRIGRLEFLRQTSEMYSEIIEDLRKHGPSLTSISDLTYEQLRYSLEHQDGQGKLFIPIFSLADIESVYQSTLENISQVEEEILSLNNETFVTIEFHAATLKYLGITS